MFMRWVLMAPVSFLMLVTCIFSLFFLVSLIRGLSILLIFSSLKKFFFLIVFLFSLLSTSSLVSIIYLFFSCLRFILGASLVAQMVKNLLAMQETWVRSLGQEDPMEKGMTTHSSILAWRIQWAKELGRLQSMESKKTPTQLFN